MSFGENLDQLVQEYSDGPVGKHESWERVRLGDIAALVNGYAFKSSHFHPSDGTPLLRIRDILKGMPGTHYNAPVDDPKMEFVSDGEIVIGMDGDFNSRIWKGGPALINQRVCTLRADERSYSQGFLAFALPAYLNLINDHTSSITVKHLSSKTVQDIPLPLPPLNEQQRILEKIETLFARLDKGEEAVRQVQKLLARYRQSVLKAAVTGQLTADCQDDWQPVELGELLTDIRYGTAKKCSYEEASSPVLRIPNVAGGEIDLADLKYTDLPAKDAAKLALQAGDLLIVRSNGSANLVARSAVVRVNAVGMAYAGYLIRLRVNQQRILPKFLHISLNSPQTRSLVERQARSTSGVHNINSAEVKALRINLPPLAAQIATVEAVNDAFQKIGDLETWCETELKRSASLRQSILRQAFAGRLVPQDPTDEPATTLLARIVAEKQPTPKPSRRRKKVSA